MAEQWYNALVLSGGYRHLDCGYAFERDLLLDGRGYILATI